MNRHRDPQTDVSGVSQRQTAEPTPLREQREHRHRHRKGDGRVRRRPAPEYPAAQPAEPEIVAEVRADAMFRMHPPRERFVGGRQQRPHERRLPDGPARLRQPRAIGDKAGEDERERQHQRHERADRCGRNHPRPQLRTARGTEIKPVKPGRDANERECDEEQMPENHPPLETAEDIFG